MKNNCWLLLEKSDETRVSKGIDGYQDITGDSYHYDSLVPNYRNLKTGDAVVIRKEEEILGIGKIGAITEKDASKQHRRCPACEATDIRERKTKSPRWKCGKCGDEFSEPLESNVKVRSYSAKIEGFAGLKNPPSVQEVKSCATKGDGQASQLSILNLDPKKLSSILEGVDVSPSPKGAAGALSGQGLGLSQEERKAVELFAMSLVRKHYEDEGWMVVDTSRSHPYDFLVSKQGQQRFVEVKGTTGEGLSVILTHAEIVHAKNHRKESALVVVANIQLEKQVEKWTATGGAICSHFDPWIINDHLLQPTQYRYQLKA
jgi:ribosomal protein S27AE